MSFTCSVRCVDNVATITPHGDLDMPATADFRKALQAAATAGDITTIVVDLHGVTFIDTTALGVLVAARSAAQRHGATFALTNPGPMVTMVLTVTDLIDTFVTPPVAA